jgi:hypothetical protein
VVTIAPLNIGPCVVIKLPKMYNFLGVFGVEFKAATWWLNEM